MPTRFSIFWKKLLKGFLKFKWKCKDLEKQQNTHIQLKGYLTSRIINLQESKQHDPGLKIEDRPVYENRESQINSHINRKLIFVKGQRQCNGEREPFPPTMLE